jgi:hypothetical protein
MVKTVLDLSTFFLAGAVPAVPSGLLGGRPLWPTPAAASVRVRE